MQVYAELSPRPIAAASLGQVYKGKLKTGETVAVKVQRPGVLETVSIDLFVIRRVTFTIAIVSMGLYHLFQDQHGSEFSGTLQFVKNSLIWQIFYSCCRRIGVFLRRFPEIKTDVPALIDEWASRFFEELDYVKEGQNATRFAESIREDLPQVMFRGSC